ncbi:hypothetical protein Ddye_022680 [Dipteronia dyeriana]|uniref:Transposase MuDR plant domain-containing protein n=1 Tax=Dipteronia dyeriana TaxID=168575 RepID=A0AAD9TS00_9ROSI|nr:hypothetical protein Ddye_022680 [Dipteronia dyeriana]
MSSPVFPTQLGISNVVRKFLTALEIPNCVSESGGKFKYQSEKSRLISVSRETSYESLEDIIYGLVNVNPNEFSIKMKYLFNSPEVLAPFEVMNDDDVQMFLCENSVVKTQTSLCVITERKTGIMPNTQGHDNGRVDEDIANVLEADILNGVGVDNIHERVFSPNEFENADVFSIGANNEDEIEGSQPSKMKSEGVGTKSSKIHGSYTSLESVVNNVKEVRVGDFFPSKEELHMNISLLSIANHFQFKVNKSTQALLVLTCRVKDCKWRVRATKLNGCDSFRVRKYQPEHT